ncbi:hypothetical protein [Natronorubrum texcoconense]|uniref:Uncharacterized protein n=1 Tax=Natronorubrum texcoconense TaxID=1095776 RepID=A0A1G8XRZ5_9EURY|nr:hypothetical protein [Natronorubrum texcoconense]SDJ93237.1 hypothetical protein SAMN04515672_1875 [Natronorubrum texcoconense]
MVRQFAARFREGIDTADLVGAVVLLGVLYALGLESSAVAVVLGIVVVTPLVRTTADAAGLDIEPALATVVLGSIVLAAGGYGVLTDDSWLGPALAVVGAWIVLDGVDAWRNGTPPDERSEDEQDISNDELLLLGEHNRWLIETLREADRPLTAAEIQSRTGLTESDFEGLLETHGESGPIERVGNGYVIDENEMGAVAMARHVVRTVGRRLLRPFRLFRPSG